MKKRPLPPNTQIHSDKGKRVFDGVLFDVYQWDQKVFNGETRVYETLKRNDSVVVLPIINGKVAIVKERQPHIDEAYFGFVAGKVEDDEDLRVAAERELREETGMKFKNLHLVYVHQYMPGVEWFGYTFIATDLVSKGEKELDGGEENEVIELSFDELFEMTRKKVFRFRPVLIEEYLLQQKEAELRDVLTHPAKHEISF